MTAEAPDARFTSLAITLEQNGKSTPLFTLGNGAAAKVEPAAANRIRITRPIGKRDLPELQTGAAKIVVTATRPAATSPLMDQSKSRSTPSSWTGSPAAFLGSKPRSSPAT